MEVHLKNKHIDSKPILGTPTIALFSIYPRYLFDYKI